MADSISAIPQQPQLGRLAQFLRYLETQNRPEFLPRQLDVMGLMAKLALPQASTVENLSYGNLPFTMPPSGTGAMIPQVKTGRKPEVADLIATFSGVPGMGAVADVGTKLSNTAADAIVRAITRNPQATAPGVLEAAGNMAPLSRMFKPEQAAKVLPETKAVDTSGNPQLLYHGTPKAIDTQLEAQKRGFISLTPDVEFANEYAGRKFSIDEPGVSLGTKTEGNPNVWPVYADVKNPFDYENPDHVKMVIDRIDFAGPANKENVTDNIARGNWNFIEDKEVQRIIKELGFDGFYMKEMGVKNLGVFSPEQVKSAVSDPAFAGLLEPQTQALAPEATGLLDDFSYRGLHTAPNREFGAPLFELNKIYPDDIYSPNAARLYGHGGDDVAMDKRTAQILRTFRGKPDAEVTIYRAVPKDETIKDINAGDWVTINKDYARQHGESVLQGEYKILERKVRAKDIWTNADSIHEFGYDPEITKMSPKEEAKAAWEANPDNKELYEAYRKLRLSE